MDVVAVSRYTLPLSGYDDASVWGYDAQGMSYYAQLWPRAYVAE